jgi:hypothetical protein
MTNKLVMVFGVSVLGTALPLLGAEGVVEQGPKQSFEVTSTERVNFPPGGTIRLDGSYGYLSVDGWDEPQVEVTIIKSTDRFYEPSQEREAKQRLELIRVVTERRADTELRISTVVPSRGKPFGGGQDFSPASLVLPRSIKGGVTVEYRIHAPRDSRLVIHNETGYVWVSDVTGDIEATSRTGDMIVMLPDPGSYSIDARTRLGSVSSDFTGKDLHNQFLVGTHFTYVSEAPSRRIYLRMGIGSITIKRGPSSGPSRKD